MNLLAILRVPLRKRDIATAKDVEDLGEVQVAGEVLLDNGLEADFYGLPSRHVRLAWPSGHLYRLRDAAVVGEVGNVFTRDGTYMAVPPNSYTQPDRKIRRPIRFGARRIEGPVFHLIGAAHQSRAHFALQALPALLAAKHFVERRPEMRVLVANGERAWQCKFIERLGIAAERVIENTPGTVVAGELYYVPPLFGQDQLCAPQVCAALRAMWPAPENAEPRSVLFISRRDAPVRRLGNEDEIVEVTRSVLGSVERVELARLPQAEQVRRFQSARWIIGPHGQGLFNGMFSSRATMVDLNGCESLPGEGTWQAAYRNAVLLNGGRAVRLVSGLRDAGAADWHFPAEEYRRQLRRLAEIAGM